MKPPPPPSEPDILDSSTRRWNRFFTILTAILIALILFFLSQEKITPELPKNPISVASSNRPLIPPLTFSDVEFPNSFFFGTASSDFQTTGGNGQTDWDNYIRTSLGKKGELGIEFVGPDIGTDFLNRYKEDFDLAGQIGIQVHRISLEWARIEPEEGKLDMNVIEQYRKIFRYMRSKGVEPMICLNHFTLPLWFAEKGGWESPEAPQYYARYARSVARNIGAPLKIKWWLTFNEPQFVISIPYQKGAWPPFKGVADLTDTEGTARLIKVTSSVMDSHRLAYREIHKSMDSRVKKVMVGFASAPGAFYPNDQSSRADLTASNIYNVLHSLSFDSFIGNADRDFIGLNYYGRTRLKLHIPSWRNPLALSWLGNKLFTIQWNPGERLPLPGERPKEFYPKALYDTIMKFKDSGLPIIITENGLSDDEDRFREEFLIIHLKAIHDAIRDGAPVIGYQYWALTDTWEWDGFFSQMGLIKIDRENGLTRSLRPSARTYADIIKTRIISKELQEKYRKLITK